MKELFMLNNDSSLKRSRLMYIFEAALEYLISILVAGSFLATITKELGVSDSLTAKCCLTMSGSQSTAKPTCIGTTSYRIIYSDKITAAKACLLLRLCPFFD